MKSFEYSTPSSIKEACALLLELGDKGKVLAGGTDLLVQMKQKTVDANHIVSLKQIGSLNYTKDDNGWIRIGAMTPLQDIVDSKLIREKIGVVAEAASQIGSVQVRTRGTIGGNVCNASPAADTIPPLICLDAILTILGPSGERKTKIESFFRGPGKVDLQYGELVTEIGVRVPEQNTKSVYLKLGRRKAVEIAIVGVGATGVVRNGRCESIRVALGSVAPTPIRAKKAEEVLKDGPLGSERILSASDEAGSECRPISDVRGSASYRRKMVKALVGRALQSIK